MPADWIPTRLGDFATLHRGIAYTAAETSEGGAVFVTIKCFEKGGGFRLEGVKRYSGRIDPSYALHGGELLIANTDLTREAGIVGAPALMPVLSAGAAVFSMDVSRVRTDGRAETRFLYHRLQRPDVRSFMQGRSGGSTVLHLHLRDVRELILQLPPVPEQVAIADILDTVDDVIRSSEAVIAKLENVKHGLLNDLLARGIDDNGQIRDPQRQPGEFKDSGIGRIPTAWATGSVLDVAPPDRQAILTGPFGAQLGTRDFVARGVPVLRIGNVRWGYIAHDDLLFVSEAKASSLDRFRVRAGDLLFARQGATTGRNALADDQCEGCLINYHIIRVAVDHKRCRPGFLHAFINSASVRAKVERDKGRGTREGINSRDIASFCIAIPPLEEQDRIVAVIEAFNARLAVERVAAKKLATVRSGLADDLLTGRVRVQAEARS